jgi:hypothetical protein
MKIPFLKKISKAEIILPLLSNREVNPNSSWNEFRMKTIRNLNSSNFANFLSWQVISQTMFVDKGHYLKFEYEQILNNISNKFREILSEDLWGNPTPSDLDQSTSGNRIHHTFLLQNYEEKTGKDISKFKIILEFGGGYGSFCRLINKLNFNGIYVIYDFDVFNIIQYNYLKKFGYSIYINAEEISKPGIYLYNELDYLNSALNVHQVDLFIATWSLSESDLNTRESFSSLISTIPSHLIAFQGNFDGIDNVEYFNKLFGDISHLGAFEHMGDKQFNLFK